MKGEKSDKSMGLLKPKTWKNSILLEGIGKYESTLEKSASFSKVREGSASILYHIARNPKQRERLQMIQRTSSSALQSMFMLQA